MIGERTTLKELEPLLRTMLEKLHQTPREARAFIIVDDTVTERFVQFAGGAGYGPTLFDVPPQRGCVATHIQQYSSDIETLVTWALGTLRGPLRLPEHAQLAVTFDTTVSEEAS